MHTVGPLLVLVLPTPTSSRYVGFLGGPESSQSLTGSPEGCKVLSDTGLQASQHVGTKRGPKAKGPRCVRELANWTAQLLW